MTLSGGCYCGALRYEASGDPAFKAQCHCRECQYISGGGPNYFMLMPAEGFSFTKGTPRQFTRSDLDNPVTREFCGDCGTHILTRLPSRPFVVLKVGSLDDPVAYGGPQMAIWTQDQQPFHLIADSMPSVPQRPQG